jgi:hypothetical protein
MPSTPSLEDIFSEVDAWFAEHLQRPPISHDVESYNQAYAARSSLKDRIATLFGVKPAAAPQPEVEQPAEAQEKPQPDAKAKPPA